MKSSSSDSPVHPPLRVWRIVGGYALLASVWIGLADAALPWLIADPAQRALAGTLKNWAFVGITALLLGVLLRRLHRRQQQALASEHSARLAQGRTQRLLQTLSESTTDAIFAKDLDGRYLMFNREAARLAGSSPLQVLGCDDDALFAPAQAAMIRSNDRRVMAQDRPETFEEEIDTADGRLVFLATKGPLHDADGQVVGLFGIARDITQRRELERQRQAAHDRMRDVLARVDDGLVALDRNWCYTYLNQQAVRMLGREKPEDLLGRHIWTEFPDGLGQPFHKAYEQAMATQRHVVFEDHYAPWDLWFENRVYPSPDGLSIYFSDITLRRRAEDALRLSELRYRLAAAGGQVWDWNVLTGLVDFPPAFWQQLGCAPPPAQQAVARFEALLHPDDLPRWRQSLREHLARRVPYELDYRARHANGTWRWFHTQGQAVWATDGRASYMAGTTFDITERQEAGAALHQSEAYRRSLFEQLGDGVLLLDREHRLLDANPQALSMLGYSLDELTRLVVRDVLPAVEHRRIDEDVARVMSGEPHLAEWSFLRKDGSRFSAEASARLLDHQRFVAVVRDISARRQTEQALLTYQRELSELAQRLLAQEKTTTQRVAQTLHDHLGQTLAGARLNLDACILLYGSSMPGPLKEHSARLAYLLAQAVREVRQVLVDLRPPLLEDQGLSAAFDNEIGASAIAGDGVDVLLEVADDATGRRWPADVEYGAFMVGREAISNARQHAAASLIRVVLGGDDSALSLDVIDDGGGIAAPLLQGRPGHLGIVGMRERALAIGARFGVDAEPAGGTRVSLRWQARGP